MKPNSPFVRSPPRYSRDGTRVGRTKSRAATGEGQAMAYMRGFTLAAALIGTALAAPAFAQQPPTCDKACLGAVMDQYLAALVAHDSRKAPLSYDVKYTENGVSLATTDGL